MNPMHRRGFLGLLGKTVAVAPIAAHVVSTAEPVVAAVQPPKVPEPKNKPFQKVFPTGLVSIDRALEHGGLVSGSINAIAGSFGSGKTSVIVEMMKRTSRHDKVLLIGRQDEGRRNKLANVPHTFCNSDEMHLFGSFDDLFDLIIIDDFSSLVVPGPARPNQEYLDRVRYVMDWAGAAQEFNKCVVFCVTTRHVLEPWGSWAEVMPPQTLGFLSEVVIKCRCSVTGEKAEAILAKYRYKPRQEVKPCEIKTT